MGLGNRSRCSWAVAFGQQNRVMRPAGISVGISFGIPLGVAIVEHVNPFIRNGYSTG